MRKLKVALLAEEFYDSNLGGYGGYGMLARHYIAEYVPNAEIEIDTILGFSDDESLRTTFVDGRKKVLFLPGRTFLSRAGRYFNKQLQSQVGRGNVSFLHRCVRHSVGLRVMLKLTSKLLAIPEKLFYKRNLKKYLDQYDVFLSIETPYFCPYLFRYISHQKLIIYIQDPRPLSEWDELDSVIGTDDGSPRPDPFVQSFYESLIRQDRVVAISQGSDLIRKARELYQWRDDLPVDLVRNPVTADEGFSTDKQPKEDAVLFLGRLDPVKRPWLALEVAKRMPRVQFYFLGTLHNPLSASIIYPYKSLPNVHFMGHRDGDVKTELLKKCKVLINTSIHEAIPVSFLEALAYGTLIVSCQNPDRITERFGAYTGKILGDGREQVGAFVNAIQGVLDDEPARICMAQQALTYVRQNHSLTNWVDNMHAAIYGAAT